jgi:aquaporin Z
MFGCVGCLVSLSAVGKISGAHINPAVSIAFWLRGKMKTTAMIAISLVRWWELLSVVCPLTVIWGEQGHSIQ